jgi:hypothetical protein
MVNSIKPKFPTLAMYLFTLFVLVFPHTHMQVHAIVSLGDDANSNGLLGAVVPVAGGVIDQTTSRSVHLDPNGSRSHAPPGLNVGLDFPGTLSPPFLDASLPLSSLPTGPITSLPASPPLTPAATSPTKEQQQQQQATSPLPEVPAPQVSPSSTPESTQPPPSTDDAQTPSSQQDQQQSQTPNTVSNPSVSAQVPFGASSPSRPLDSNILNGGGTDNQNAPTDTSGTNTPSSAANLPAGSSPPSNVPSTANGETSNATNQSTDGTSQATTSNNTGENTGDNTNTSSSSTPSTTESTSNTPSTATTVIIVLSSLFLLVAVIVGIKFYLHHRHRQDKQRDIESAKLRAERAAQPWKYWGSMTSVEKMLPSYKESEARQDELSHDQQAGRFTMQSWRSLGTGRSVNGTGVSTVSSGMATMKQSMARFVTFQRRRLSIASSQSLISKDLESSCDVILDADETGHVNMEKQAVDSNNLASLGK